MPERTTVADLRTAAAGLEQALAAADGRWGRPSPCTGWTAADVADHVLDWLRRGAEQVGSPVSDGSTDRRQQLRELVDGICGAIEADPEVLERPMSLSGQGGGLPGFITLGILTTDVLVHSWDLARAAGSDVVLDEGLSRRSLEGARPMEAQIRGSDSFGPAVAVPDDASVQDQMLGFFGRDPAWGR